jgi:hypothetical protein
MKYAQSTEVTSDKTRGEIERTLTRYGATKFAYGWDAGRAVIQFEARSRRVRFTLPLPAIEDFYIVRNKHGRLIRRRTPAQAKVALDQATRQRWRALLLCIKAKLESVESSIEEFDEAFMAQIVLPNGSTVGDQVKGEIGSAYAGGQFSPFLLPAPKGTDN